MLSSDESWTAKWERMHTTVQAPFLGPSFIYHLPCPTCRSESGKWCSDGEKVRGGGPMCDERFQIWRAMGRPRLRTHTQLDPLMLAMWKAAHD